MHAVFIVAIVFGSIVTLAGLLCGTVLVLMRLRHANRPSAGQETSQDEAMMIQEIYRGLEKMEKRIEALETILMDGQEKNGDRQ
jgi:phage shock protein B